MRYRAYHCVVQAKAGLSASGVCPGLPGFRCTLGAVLSTATVFFFWHLGQPCDCTAGAGLRSTAQTLMGVCVRVCVCVCARVCMRLRPCTRVCVRARAFAHCVAPSALVAAAKRQLPIRCLSRARPRPAGAPSLDQAVTVHGPDRCCQCVGCHEAHWRDQGTGSSACPERDALPLFTAAAPSPPLGHPRIPVPRFRAQPGLVALTCRRFVVD
mmetsp:Transcript_16033/g.25736  ORF Transcript_16033/g.25736 Transcript_16033/m.25736 type:complete len:212 (-) Transcript_16033:220-855(-)